MSFGERKKIRFPFMYWTLKPSRILINFFIVIVRYRLCSNITLWICAVRIRAINPIKILFCLALSLWTRNQARFKQFFRRKNPFSTTSFARYIWMASFAVSTWLLTQTSQPAVLSSFSNESYWKKPRGRLYR